MKSVGRRQRAAPSGGGVGVFDGKVVLVTGGTSGIGRAASAAFAREGGRVVLCGRDPTRGAAVEEEIRTAGGEALFVRCDVSRADEVEALVRRTVERFGRLDCAFNNAASYDGGFRLLADFDEAEFDRTIAVDLKGVWLAMKHELRQLVSQSPSGGAIVNTSSVNGLGGAAMASLYAAAKAGILALTKSAAYEYAARGVRVNALVPGAFDTPMQRHGQARLAGGDPERRKALEAGFLALVPAGRMGRPEEAAAAVLWLCSDAASYVTGSSLIVDGGVTAFAR
jgi:NAD(P)-dependent dehydrogenase (short-subunit alcohol dehydrogenase family)